MVPLFVDGAGPDARDTQKQASTSGANKGRSRPVVGVRVPYDMPLQRYGPGETPWVASLIHTEPDRHGQIWEV